MTLLEILLQNYTEESNVLEYIDENSLFVKGGLNIIYGEKSSGKTFGIIKAMNKSNIVPIVLDYDNNPKLNFKYSSFRGSDEILDTIVDNSTSDDIVVIDHLDGMSKGRYMSEEDATQILDRLKSISATVILLNHATVHQSATRKTISFRGNDKIANNADTVYKLENHTLVVEKRRGAPIDDIDEWML